MGQGTRGLPGPQTQCKSCIQGSDATHGATLAQVLATITRGLLKRCFVEWRKLQQERWWKNQFAMRDETIHNLEVSPWLDRVPGDAWERAVAVEPVCDARQGHPRPGGAPTVEPWVGLLGWPEQFIELTDLNCPQTVG